MTSNTDMLNDVLDMGVADMAALLTVIADEATEAMGHTRSVKDRLNGAPDFKHGAGGRAAAGKDVAILRFGDGDCMIVADLPERVTWDQQCLAKAGEVTRHGWRHNPAQYVRTEIKGSEAAYRSWPAVLRCLFDPARAIETGKPAYRIEPAGKEAA